MHDGLILGVDGGGSGSRAIIADLHGAIRSVQIGPACNYQNSDPSEITDVLRQLLQRCVQDLGNTRLAVDFAAFGMAGLDSTQDAHVLREVVQAALRDSFIDVKQVAVENDAIVTLYGLIGNGPGVLVLSGTGSIAWGVSPPGERIRSGGWGHRLGDEGSGYAIGKKALRAMLRGHDGRGPFTDLEPALLAVLDLHSPAEVVQWANSDACSVTEIARLAPTVLSLAAAGNAVARVIVEAAATDLVDLVTAVVTRLALDATFDAVLCGGILENHPILRDEVIKRISVRHPGCRVIADGFPASLGAAAYALRACGANMTQSTHRLQQEYHPLDVALTSLTGVPE